MKRLLPFSLLPSLMLSPALAGAALDDGLVAHWSFEGDFTDATGLGHDGIPMNGVGFSTGKVGLAAAFDGIADFVRIPYASDLQFGSGGFSVGAWMRPNQGADSVRVVENRGTGTGGGFAGWQIKISNNSGVWNLGRSLIDDGAGNFVKCDDCGANHGYDDWHYVTLVREDDGNLSFYVDGVLDAIVAGQSVAGLNNGIDLNIGAGYAANGVEGNPSQYFPGLIDEVRVYNRPLSAAEVASLFEVSGGSGAATGSVWHSGSGVPDAQLGEVGDFYLDNATGDVYAKGESGWVYQTNLTGPGISEESDPTVPEALKDGVSWSELDSIPAGFADGIDNGIQAEVDPTVPAWLKDGVSWGEIAGIPEGFQDGSDDGITVEQDPEVASTVVGRIPKWDGSRLVDSAGLSEDESGNVSTSGNLSVAGSLRLGFVDLPCDSAGAGLVRWNPGSAAFEGCDGASWINIACTTCSGSGDTGGGGSGDGGAGDAQTSLLLHAEDLTDSSANGFVVSNWIGGGAVAITPDGHFGSAFEFDGYTKLEVAYDPALDLAGTDFTIDFWFKAPTSVDNGRQALLFMGTNGSRDGFSINYADQGTGMRFTVPGPDTQHTLQTDWLPTPHVWHHLAAVMENGILTLYADGQNIGSGAITILPSSAPLIIGGGHTWYSNGIWGGSPLSFTYIGMMDELRISKGVVRWSGNFTPPTAPY